MSNRLLPITLFIASVTSCHLKSSADLQRERDCLCHEVRNACGETLQVNSATGVFRRQDLHDEDCHDAVEFCGLVTSSSDVHLKDALTQIITKVRTTLGSSFNNVCRE